MNLLSALIVFAGITVGGVSYQIRIATCNAVVYYQDGHTAQVRVINSGDFFCPRNCKAAHRHRVHDVLWTCPQGASCSHFTVFHVRQHHNETRLAALKRELRERDTSKLILPATLAVQ